VASIGPSDGPRRAWGSGCAGGLPAAADVAPGASGDRGAGDPRGRGYRRRSRGAAAGGRTRRSRGESLPECHAAARHRDDRARRVSASHRREPLEARLGGADRDRLGRCRGSRSPGPRSVDARRLRDDPRRDARALRPVRDGRVVQGSALADRRRQRHGHPRAAGRAEARRRGRDLRDRRGGRESGAVGRRIRDEGSACLRETAGSGGRLSRRVWTWRAPGAGAAPGSGGQGGAHGRPASQPLRARRGRGGPGTRPRERRRDAGRWSRAGSRGHRRYGGRRRAACRGGWSRSVAGRLAAGPAAGLVGGASGALHDPPAGRRSDRGSSVRAPQLPSRHDHRGGRRWRDGARPDPDAARRAAEGSRAGGGGDVKTPAARVRLGSMACVRAPRRGRRCRG